MKQFLMSFTTAKKACDKAGSNIQAPGPFYNMDPYQLLAIHIIIRIRKDLKRTRDPYEIAALLRWFDTSWGITICDLIGVEASYIKEVLKNETAKKHK